MPDRIFDDPRLAQVYDPLDPDRSDLDVYIAMVDELGARWVLDVGCGTGTFACLLAGRGIDVTAVDPARASLDVARTKPGSSAVQWLFGDATMLPPLSVDAAFMTANVAQVFLTDDDWHATLDGIRSALRPGGTLVFETRDPAKRAVFHSDGAALESISTLRFRERSEIEASLMAHGYEQVEVRDAPDRPGREFVFLSRRAL